MDRILHYEIARQLGAGKNGATYVGIDTGLQRAVALKVIEHLPDAQPKWEVELQALIKKNQGLTIGEVSRVFALEKCNGQPVYVREYVEGESLGQIIDSTRIDYPRFLDITLELVRGLKRLHDQDLIHGNLTTNNVLIDTSGHVHLVDIGLARPALESGDDLVFLSPERLAGARPNQASDLYALGVILYFLLVGQPPFTGSDPTELRAKICTESVDYTAKSHHPVPGVARLLISKLMARDPSDRFASSEELLHTVQGMVSLGAEPPMEIMNTGWTARQYLMISILVLLLIIFWLILTLPTD